MEAVTNLPGVFTYILIVSALLTVLVSLFLLWQFKRATLKKMSETGSQEEFFGLPAVTGREAGRDGPPPPLLIEEQKPLPDTFTQKTLTTIKSSLLNITLAYAAAGCVYAVIFTIPWLVNAEGGFNLTRLAFLFTCYIWPLVLTICLLRAINLKQVCRITGVYSIIFFVLVLFILFRNADSSLAQLLFFWCFANGMSTLLLLFFLHKNVRSVGPLVFAFMVTGTTGTYLLPQTIDTFPFLLEQLVHFGGKTGLSATVLFYLLLASGFVLFALLGWQIILFLGKHYQRKTFSDQSITIDALWLVFGMAQSITLIFEGVPWLFTGLAAFFAYRTTLSFCFRHIKHKDGSQHKPKSLLLLRVFSLGKRSESFFDSFAKYWRRIGSISLISGPDLVTSMVEPHEFLDFLSGKLSRLYVQGEKDLHKRMQELDLQPDPDGRYRINDFFCRDTSWQATMRLLAKESDVILMDIRSFSPQNSGCVYELEQLLNIADLNRTVFLVDELSDRTFLEKTLFELWKSVPPDSPNLKTPVPTVCLFSPQGDISHSLPDLLHLLLSRCS